jgi:ATP-dependent exoDNAse (exonuclease V) beta subunit
MNKLDIEDLLQNKHKLNKDQKRAVECFDNCVVKAGAGAGKTTVLAFRFLNLILQNEANCDEILTLTFTKKAAAEMYERIYNQLLIVKDRLPIMEKQFSLFPKATISTIDSFCNQIVKQDCIRYGIPSDFSIDNNKASQITKRCTQQLIENEDILPGFEFLSKAYSPNIIIDDILVKLANSSFYFPLEFEKDRLFEECKDLINSSIQENADNLLVLFSNIVEPDYGVLTPKTKSTIKELEIFYEKLCTYEVNSPGFISVLDSISFTVPRKTKNPSTESLNENCKSLKETVTDLKSLYFIKENNHIENVVAALEVLKDKIFEEKRRSGILTFSDISHLAVDILLTNKKIRKIYKEKFKFIMIDEFQDNNQLQKDLTYLLGEKKDVFKDGIPNIYNVETRKLFFVGDEKQSIYRFRDADVSVFKALSKELEESGGTVINLGVNYRSEPKLIDYFNQTFSRVFENAKQPFEAEFEALDSRSPIDGLKPRIQLYIKSEESTSLVSDDAEKATSFACEATKMAKVIKTMLSSDDYLIPSKDGLKRPEVDDIAILMRFKTHQIEFEKALRAKKIPFIIQDNKAFPLEALTNDIYNILQLIVYPDDKLAYTSVLKGPFGAISEKTIIQLLYSFDCENLFEIDIPIEGEDIEKLEQLKNTFDELIELSKDNDISSLLNYVWWDAGLRYYYVCESNYHLYIDNYDYLYRLAKKYDINQASLSIFLDEIRNSLGSSSQEEEVAVLKESSKGVQLMTIHKSKGLEFPIVVVSNMGAAIRDNGVDFSIENNIPIPKHCITIDKTTGKEKYDSIYIERAKALRKEMELAEIKRILYVALTRAQTHLIMSATIRTSIDNEILGNKDKSLLAMIYNSSLMENNEINPNLELEEIEVVGAYENFVKVEKKPIIERKQFFNNKKYYQQCDENYDVKSKKIGVTTLFGHKDDGDFETGYPLPSSDIDQLLFKLSEDNDSVYKDFGTLCHIYVQSLILNKPILSLIDESVLSKSSSLSKLKASQIKLIEQVALDYAKAFIDSDFAINYVKDNNCRCEVGFFSRVENEIGENLVVEGFIDLLIEDKEHNYIVVDFKTDKFRNPEIHEKQLSTYITAVKRLHPNSGVTGCVVYLRSKDKEYFY